MDGTSLDWEAIYDGARRLASGLAELGIGRGDVVCHMSANSPGHVRTLFAIALLGAVECPINAGLRGEPLRHVLVHSEASAIIVESHLLDRLVPELPSVDRLRHLIVRGTTELPTSTSLAVVREEDVEGVGEPPAIEVAPADPAMLMYTSGTTGPAKGVVIPNHFVFTTAAIKVGIWGLTRDDVLFTALPLFHANARFSTLLTACVLDARAVIVPRFSASSFWHQVIDAGATEVGTVGTMPGILLKATTATDAAGHRVRMMHGAGGLSVDQREEFERRFDTRLVVGFAMTETSHVSTTAPDDPGRLRGAGRPVPGFELAILDPDDGRLGQGEVGEIAIRPSIPFSMFQGYYKDPVATSDAFRNLWFHTGDVGYLDPDGYLHWVDRKKDAIRRKGEMVSSRDVEGAALGIDGVAEAAAVGVPAELGEEEIFLFVVTDAGEGVLPTLHDHLRARLPDFALPRYYRVVEALPSTPTHKVDKRRLRSEASPRLAWDALEHLEA